MKRLWVLAIATCFCFGLSFNRTQAQDVGAEIRESWGDEGSALAQLEGELSVLVRVEAKLNEEYAELLKQISIRQEELSESSVAPDSLATLLQSCLVEIQRLRWEEATEKVVQEELSKEGAIQMVPAIDLKLNELENQRKTTRLKLGKAKEDRDRVKLLHEKGVIPEGELHAKEAFLEAIMLELQNVEETLSLQTKIAESERQQPLAETTRRLAELVSRRRLLEQEVVELRDEYKRLMGIKQRQWQVGLSQKRAELIQEQLVPLQTRKLKVEALIEFHRAVLKDRQKK